jgi:hypothetical protein
VTKVDRVTDEETGHTFTLELHDGDCRVGLKCESDECGEIVVLDEKCQLCESKVMEMQHQAFMKLNLTEMQDEVKGILLDEKGGHGITYYGWVARKGEDPHHFLNNHPVDGCDGTSLDGHFLGDWTWDTFPEWLQMMYEEIANKRIENGGGVVCRF